MTTKTYYKITFPDNTCYIGATTRCWKRRMTEHRCESKQSKHQNYNIQAVYDKYGYDDWVYEWLFVGTGSKKYHSIRENTLISQEPRSINIRDGRLVLVGGPTYHINYSQTWTDEYNKTKKIRDLERYYKNKEQVSIDNKIKRNNMTLEQQELKKRLDRGYQQAKKDNMTPEELKEYKKQNSIAHKQRRNNMTLEQREEKKRRDREYRQRKRDEKKRSGDNK